MDGLATLQDTARSKVDRYTDPAGPYAFRAYDVTPTNRSDTVMAEDVLAANLLSLRLGWSDVVPLFAEGDGPPQRLLTRLNDALVALREAQQFQDIATETELLDVFAPLATANEATRHVKGWTPVTVSKVLHRHAPHVVPLVDSRVRAFYGTRAGHDGELRRRLWVDIRDNIDWLRLWLSPLLLTTCADRTLRDGRPNSRQAAGHICAVRDTLVSAPGEACWCTDT